MLYKYFYNNFALFDTCADIHPFEFPTKEGALIREKTGLFSDLSRQTDARDRRRPFVYLIYDTVTRMPIFIGVLNDPTE